MKHSIILADDKIQKLLGGKLNYEYRFFKRRPEFLNQLSSGDIVYFRAAKASSAYSQKSSAYFRERGEVLGQFEVGKIVVIEGLEKGDWKLLKEYGMENIEYGREKFEEDIKVNNTMLIVQITKLEQFITSPIEVDKRSKKEWIVLE